MIVSKKRINLILVSIFLFFSWSSFVFADVMVTEIAWMGTAASANDEWIEIYNSGDSVVNLSGWTLNASDGTPTINLSGTLNAGAYALLERTDDTSYPGINALVIFTGALGNDGESLTLKNGGTTVQSLSFSGGWPAGDSSSKQTMQWTGSSWVTADETAGGPTVVGSDTNNDDDDDQSDDQNDDDDDDDSETTTTTTTGQKNVLKKKVYDDRVFEISYNKKAVAGSPAYFSAQAYDFDRTKMYKGFYVWNMGDGTVRQYSRKWEDGLQDFYHIYEYPGTYFVTLKYYQTYFEDTPPDIEESFEIDVIEANISIDKVHPDGAIALKNVTGSNIDLSDWVLQDSFGKRFVIPEGSVLLPSKSVTFSSKVTRLSPAISVSILTPSGSLVDTFSSAPKKVVRSYSGDTSSKSKSENIVDEAEEEGEVLGVSDSKQEEVIPDNKKEKDNGVVFFLSFVILILIAVIAVLLLNRNEEKEEGDEYELLDE